MTLQKLSCPNCNRSLRINTESRDQIFCPYCGQAFLTGDGKRGYLITRNQNIVNTMPNINHVIDDSEKIREKYDRRRMIGIVGFIIVIIVCAAMTGFTIGHKLEAGTESVIAKKVISAGSYYDYEDEKYEAVIAQLEALGFTNITAIDLDDSGLKFWLNEKVDSVSVGGDTSFTQNDYFDPDITIIVKYH